MKVLAVAVPPADHSPCTGPDLRRRTAAGRARVGRGALERQRAEASTVPRPAHPADPRAPLADLGRQAVWPLRPATPDSDQLA